VKRAVLALLLLLAGTAHADVETFHAEGSATGDATTGKSAALDAAFRLATMAAVDQLAPVVSQKLAMQALKDEVFARARLWVASFKIKATTEGGGELTLGVDVRIDLDKLRDKLVELGVALYQRTAEPAETEDAPAGARDAVLLMRVDTVEGPIYSFGEGQDERVPGADDAEASLARRGLALVLAPARGGAASTGLPTGDDAARDLARDAGAEVAIIAAVDVAAPGRVRGAAGVATLAHAQVRAIDVATGRVLGASQAARGATGNGASEVSGMAVRAALLEALAVALPRREPASAAPALPLPVAGKGEALVRIRGATGAEAEAIRAYVVSAQGVKRASLRRIGADEVIYAIRGLAADRVSALIRGAGELRADARVVEGAVEVTIEALPELPSAESPW